eukprot:1445570-Rhodomonas_salina.1
MKTRQTLRSRRPTSRSQGLLPLFSRSIPTPPPLPVHDAMLSIFAAWSVTGRLMGRVHHPDKRASNPTGSDDTYKEAGHAYRYFCLRGVHAMPGRRPGVGGARGVSYPIGLHTCCAMSGADIAYAGVRLANINVDTLLLNILMWESLCVLTRVRCCGIGQCGRVYGVTVQTSTGASMVLRNRAVLTRVWCYGIGQY